MEIDEYKALTARREGGRRAKINGDDSETLILSLCAEYLKQGRARLEKVDPPSRVVGGGKFRRIIYLANPFLDLAGAWTEKDGRALFFEVKSTTKNRLPISRKNGVTEKQIAALVSWADAGATTALLWVHAGGLKVISTATIEDACARGAPSIPWGDFPLCRRGTSPFLRWDFLSELADA